MRAACPIHKGKRDSFAVNPETGQWFCHSQCGRGGSIFDFESKLNGTDFESAYAEVLRIVGRPSPNGTGRRVVATYNYTDEQGALLHQTVRYEPKGFSQRRPNGAGGWIANLEGVRLVLYNLPAVIASPIVFVVEGEKDADSLNALGVVGTCNAMGAGKWRAEYAQWLRGKHVIIIPDADEPGRKHAERVAASLTDAASVKTVVLPGGAKDASEWIAAGGTLEQLTQLCEAVSANTTVSHAANDSGWSPPVPLGDDLPPVELFDETLLPESLRSVVVDTSERMQVPPDYVATAIIVCLAGCVSRRAEIQPKACDDSWWEVCNLWGGIVGLPGFLKTPVLAAITAPLVGLETGLRDQYEKESEGYEHEKRKYDILLDAWKANAKRKAKANSSISDFEEEKPDPPVQQRLIINDPTHQKLHDILRENPLGVLVLRDELTGLLATLDQEGKEGARQFFLECWSGKGGFTMDRIQRGSVHAPNVCISLLGGIQPARLRSYLVDALKDGPSNDGLIQRFQVLVYPDHPSSFSYIDRLPNSAAFERLAQTYRKLHHLQSTRFRFAPDAQEMFAEWYCRLQQRIRTAVSSEAAINMHLNKYPKLMPVLCTLFHLADGQTTTEISLPYAQIGADYCNYAETHARRIYSCITSPQLKAARDLAKKILERRIGETGSFNIREIYLKGWSGLSEPDQVRPAIKILEELGWVRPERRAMGLPGRPPERYEINPLIWAKKSQD